MRAWAAASARVAEAGEQDPPAVRPGRFGFDRQGRLLRALVDVRWPLLAAGAISLAANLLMLTPTVYMLQLYERVLNSGNLMTLAAVSLMALLSLMAMAWADRQRNRRLITASVRLDRLLAHPVLSASHQAVLAGRAVPTDGGAALADLARLRAFITGPVSVALFDLPWTPIYIGVLWLLHPWLGYAGTGFIALQAVQAAWGHRRTRAAAERQGLAERSAQVYLQHKFGQAETVEAMGMGPGLWERWQQRHRAQLDAVARAHSVGNQVQAGSRFLRYAQQSLALGLGGWLVARGELGVGAMIAANVLAVRALAPVDALAGGFSVMHAAMAGARRLEALLGAWVPVEPASGPPAFGGHLRLDVDEVRAPGVDRVVLRDIHLELLPGTVTVLMGPTGAGKSTLARVLAGAWPGAPEGLLHDGRRLSAGEREALGRATGYLPQEIELADAPLRDNIARLGRADPEAVIEAARRCTLHEAILRLPKGYDTPVGPGGVPLSGGMRQRVALARALYGNPRLLILDEPNAHLDDVGEAALAETLRQCRDQGGTCLVVSHRQGVLAVADRVLLLDAGRIVADGPRDTVLAAAARPATPAVARAGAADERPTGQRTSTT